MNMVNKKNRFHFLATVVSCLERNAWEAGRGIPPGRPQGGEERWRGKGFFLSNANRISNSVEHHEGVR